MIFLHEILYQPNNQPNLTTSPHISQFPTILSHSHYWGLFLTLLPATIIVPAQIVLHKGARMGFFFRVIFLKYKSKHGHPLLYVIWWLLIVLRIKRKFPTCPLCSAMVWRQPASFNLSLSLPSSLPQVCCPHTLNLNKLFHAPRLLYYIIQGANSSSSFFSSFF